MTKNETEEFSILANTINTYLQVQLLNQTCWERDTYPVEIRPDTNQEPCLMSFRLERNTCLGAALVSLQISSGPYFNIRPDICRQAIRFKARFKYHGFKCHCASFSDCLRRTEILATGSSINAQLLLGDFKRRNKTIKVREGPFSSSAYIFGAPR